MSPFHQRPMRLSTSWLPARDASTSAFVSFARCSCSRCAASAASTSSPVACAVAAVRADSATLADERCSDAEPCKSRSRTRSSGPVGLTYSSCASCERAALARCRRLACEPPSRASNDSASRSEAPTASRADCRAGPRPEGCKAAWRSRRSASSTSSSALSISAEDALLTRNALVP